jgi:phosphopantetheine--protein transferase-like protein
MSTPAGNLAGVGCDTETCARFRQLLEHNGRFLERWFTEHERSTFLGAEEGLDGLASRATLLFTLKEAAIKALWSHQHLLPDAIEIRSIEPHGSGPARAVLFLARHTDLPVHLDASFVPVPDGWESTVLAYGNPGTATPADPA